MNLSKWANIIKIILLKIVEEIERRINEKNGAENTSGFASSVYTSLKFIVLDQVDSLVDEAVGYTKRQINELSSLIAAKTSIILSSLVYILIIVGVGFITYIYMTISLALYIGEKLGGNWAGFMVVSGINLIVLLLLHLWGRKLIAEKIKNHLLKLV